MSTDLLIGVIQSSSRLSRISEISTNEVPYSIWLDVNDIDSLWSDTFRSVSVANDGDPVAVIDNQKGSIL